MRIRSNGKRKPSYPLRWLQRALTASSGTTQVDVVDDEYCYSFNCTNLQTLRRATTLLIKEPGTIRWLRQQAQPGRTFLDIGANVGLYLIWLKSIDADREYIGFEPNPACYWYLQELIRYNQFGNSKIFPLALSDVRQLRKFFAKRFGDKMGSLLATHRVEAEKPLSFSLITEPGDAIIHELDLKAISAIKIDVEGFELEVIRGLKDTLAKHHPALICEVLAPVPGSSNYEASMSRIEGLLALLGDCNYIALSLGVDNELHVTSEAHDYQVYLQADRILVHRNELDSIMKLWSRAN
jgi:FkbM family methyltransferase